LPEQIACSRRLLLCLPEQISLLLWLAEQVILLRSSALEITEQRWSGLGRLRWCRAEE